MQDVHTKEQRSRNMSAIRAKGNKSTELRLIKLLRKNGISGWRRHIKITGTPDFIFPVKRIAVFVDGCFWHGCTKCNLRPKTNRFFWQKKISDNIRRDKKVSKILRSNGWRVLRIKEHQFKKEMILIKYLVKNITLIL